MKKSSTVIGRMRVGSIVQILLSNVGLAKGDNKNLTLVAVEVTFHAKEEPSHKLVHVLFQIQNYCKGGGITVLKNVGAKVVNLDGVLDGCQ